MNEYGSVFKWRLKERLRKEPMKGDALLQVKKHLKSNDI